MRILGLDTATSVASVALAVDGELIRELSHEVGHGHAEWIPGNTVELLRAAGLEPADIELVAVGVGPGPYTAVRVGVAFARSLALALGVPVVGVCSLDVIAADVIDRAGGFVVATDARRREVYWAAYGPDGHRLVGPLVGPPAAEPGPLNHSPRWAGNGADRFGELAAEVGVTVLEPRNPSAAALVRLAGEWWSSDARGGGSDRATGAGFTVWDDHSADGSGVAVPTGRCLPAWPLYLRRPDARPPSGLIVELREPRWPDLAEVARIEAELFSPDAWSVETWWSELAGCPDRRSYLLATAGGRIIGYGGMAWNPLGAGGSSADLQTLAVLPPFQRRGVARRLLDALLEQARVRGCRECLLEVRADNSPARALYEARGFTEIARRNSYYSNGGSAVVMRADLTSTGEVDRG